MLMEIWEHLRGYRRWTQAEAKVEFLKEEHLYHDKDGKDLHYSYVTGQRLAWTDSTGTAHYAPLKKLGDDAKYQLAEGEAETIRYNPANPVQFYCRRISELKVRYYVSTACGILGVAIFCIGYVWVREMLGCSR
jgi:hypothetical protein